MLSSKLRKYIKITTGNKFLTNRRDPLRNLKMQKIKEAKWISKFLNLNEQNEILDYGAGFGFISNAIAKQVKFIHTYDVDDQFIKLCAKICESHSNIIHHGPTLDKLKKIKVDTIIAKDVVETFNYNHMKKVFKLFSKISNPKAKILFNFYNKDYCNNKYINLTHYTIKQIENIANYIKFKILLLEKDKLISFVLLKRNEKEKK